MHEAPRLENYWQKLEGHLLRMLRDDWDQFAFPTGEMVKIDLSKTPLATLAKRSEFIGAVGRRISSSEVEILAYRRDKQDHPNEINVYRYLVMESFPARLNLLEVVQTADTDLDSNLQGYLTDYVFITVMYLPAEQHHIRELPTEVEEVLNAD